MAIANPRRRRSPGAPTKLRAQEVTATSITLTWSAPAGKSVAGYDVSRDGRRVGRVRGRTYVDRHLRADVRHSYTVRARGADGKRSNPSKPLPLRTLPAPTPERRPIAAATPKPAPAAAAVTALVDGATSTLPDVVGAVTGTIGAPPSIAGPAAPAPAHLDTPMTSAMVDRYFWRAGFGPTDSERNTWAGRSIGSLIDHFMTTPQTYDHMIAPTVTGTNGPLDPVVLADSPFDQLLMEWLDRMLRATNPLSERLTFFWHRHFAIVSDAIPRDFLQTYVGRLRTYGDLAANPNASFRDLAVEMTTKDFAMSRFLTMCLNRAGNPNENYAREFMELFCLGVRDAADTPNYTQNDVGELARAFTGYWGTSQGTIDFSTRLFDAGQKTIFGQTANFAAVADTPAGAHSAVDLVLSQPNHGPHIVRKLWAEFIVAPIPDSTLADLVSAYTAGGLTIAPVVRAILSHPLMLESLDEPNMIKPPVVFLVGAHRQLAAPMKGTQEYDQLIAMQQVPYLPPNVAGWEGGTSWLNTMTARARFSAIQMVLSLKHTQPAFPTHRGGYPGAVPIPDPGAGETAAQAVQAALAACGTPWLSPTTLDHLQAFSAAHPVANATDRLRRAYSLRALVLGGPDAQVM